MRGPWDELVNKPFVKDIWMPSLDLLEMRENTDVEFEHTDLLLQVLIKPSYDFST